MRPDDGPANDTLVLLDGLVDEDERRAAGEYFDAFRWDQAAPDLETMSAAEFMGLF